jgi:hypothetical protein
MVLYLRRYLIRVLWALLETLLTRVLYLRRYLIRVLWALWLFRVQDLEPGTRKATYLDPEHRSNTTGVGNTNTTHELDAHTLQDYTRIAYKHSRIVQRMRCIQAWRHNRILYKASRHRHFAYCTRNIAHIHHYQ